MEEENYPEEAAESAPAAKASPLPWVLFGLSVLLGAIIAVVQLIRVDAAKTAMLQAQADAEAARTSGAGAEKQAKDLQGQLDSLQSEKASLTNDRDACMQKLQAAQSGVKATAGKTAAKKSKKKKH
jgi:septal ring factor EnvC (AmiA/AmiB activator)